jgi:hypothetical protein
MQQQQQHTAGASKVAAKVLQQLGQHLPAHPSSSQLCSSKTAGTTANVSRFYAITTSHAAAAAAYRKGINSRSDSSAAVVAAPASSYFLQPALQRQHQADTGSRRLVFKISIPAKRQPAAISRRSNSRCNSIATAPTGSTAT